MLVVFAIYPLIGNFIKKNGIKKSTFLFMVPYLAGYVLLFITKSWVVAIVAYVPIMITRSLVITTGSLMSAMMIDENEALTGTRKPGLFEAINALLNAPLAGAQLVLYTYVIEQFGFQSGGIAQTARAIFGIRFATAGIPIIFCILGIVPLILYPYDIARERQLSKFSIAQRSINSQEISDMSISNSGSRQGS